MESVIWALPEPELVFVAFFVSLAFSWWSYNNSKPAVTHLKSLDHLIIDKQTKKILKVEENVYIASGYGTTTCALIEGDDGWVLFNALDSFEWAMEARSAFSFITAKPLKAIILSRFEPSFVNGLPIWLENDSPLAKRQESPRIFVHESFPKVMEEHLALATKQRMNIFSNMTISADGPNVPIELLRTFPSDLTVDICGLTLELVHLGGLAKDEIGLWWPDQRIFFASDSIGLQIPDLFPIHGGPQRDPLQWIECVEKVQKLRPEVLIMSQARPILVREEIQEVLEIQQAIIKFLHDQTVRHMNKGLFPDLIVELIKLPQALENHPIKSHSQVPTSWIIRGLFNYYMGWFSGKASELNPLSPSVAKTKWIQLLGGELNVLQHAQQALDQGELEWGLELIELLQGANSSPESRALHNSIMLQLASRPNLSAKEREFFTSLAGPTLQFAQEPTKSLIAENLTLNECHMILRSRVDPSKFPDGFHKRIRLRFTDHATLSPLLVEIRNSVVVIQSDSSEGQANKDCRSTLSVELELDAWKVFCVHGTLDERYQAYYQKMVGPYQGTK